MSNTRPAYDAYAALSAIAADAYAVLAEARKTGVGEAEAAAAYETANLAALALYRNAMASLGYPCN